MAMDGCMKFGRKMVLGKRESIEVLIFSFKGGGGDKVIMIMIKPK
jgi:hypothetical protein